MAMIDHYHKPLDLKNWAYETIKRRILNIEVNAGEQLRIESLAEQLGTSRTPVREALLKLESEGLVRAASRVGFFVRGITKKDLEELFELREILESFAAEKAAGFVDGQDIRILKEYQRRAGNAISEGNTSEFMEMEIAIHTLILRKADNSRLIQMIEGIKDLIRRERILSLKSSENIRESFKEHRGIIDALKNKDTKMAGKMMRSHIVAVRDRLTSFLELPKE
jgi:DNA-binding GntR family transcriptional regulator